MLSAISKKKEAFITGLKYAFIYLPAAIYFFFVLKYTVNIPLWDDYNEILDYTLSYKNAHGLAKISLLFLQSNEHRIFLSRIITVCYFYIAGNINFINLAIIGDLELLFTFIIFIRFLKKSLPGQWHIAAFVLGLCMFDLNTWQNADFASACMANYGVVLLFVASLYCYSAAGKRYIVPAVILQICCTFSYGNGIIASAFLLTFNLLNRNSIKSLSSGATFVIFSALYFSHYTSPALVRPLVGKPEMISYFFHFVSAYIGEGFFNQPIIVGILFFACLVIALPVNKKLQIKPGILPWVCILGFIILSMVPTAIFRSNVVPYIPSRYRLYSNLLPAILFIFLIARLNERKMIKPVAAICTLVILFAYTRDFKTGSYDFAHARDVFTTVDYYDDRKADAQRISIEACRQKIYCIDEHRGIKIIF